MSTRADLEPSGWPRILKLRADDGNELATGDPGAEKLKCEVLTRLGGRFT